MSLQVTGCLVLWILKQVPVLVVVGGRVVPSCQGYKLEDLSLWALCA